MYFTAANKAPGTGACKGSVGLSDERPLSGIGIQWQLSGDESEEWTVAERPTSAGRVSPASQSNPDFTNWKTTKLPQ
jgi:hypothetical protein